MHDDTTQSVDDARSHAERGNEIEQHRGVFWPLFVLLLVAAATLLVMQSRRPQPPNPMVGRPLPPLEVGGWLNTAGPLRAEDLRGQVVLVDFWATSCPPCVAQLPELASLHERFGEHGLLLVGLTPEPEGEGRLTRFVEGVPGMAWPIGYGAGMAFELMGIYGTPTYVLYDRTGRSVWGSHSLAGVEDAIVAALAKKVKS